jgi:hypothetical protein
VFKLTKEDHLGVRRGYWLRLGVLAAAAAASFGLLIVSSASGAKVSSTVALKFKVTGSGTVSVSGRRAVTCRAGHCSHTFHVPRRERIVINASPQSGWKLTTWAGACKGSSETCSLRLKAERSAAVAFAPPGSHSNPYPLDAGVTLTGPTGNWQVTVDSATINATDEVEAVIDPVQGTHPNLPPPAGWQYSLVNLTMTYAGSGSATASSFLASPGQLWAEGRGFRIYPPDGCQPPQPDLGSAGRLSSGESTTGNLCYEIRSQSAGTLLLSGQARNGKNPRTVWFALR